MRVALLTNLEENAPHLHTNTPHDALYELDHPHNVEAYKAAIEAHGHQVFPMEGDAFLAQRLKDLAIDVCFNVCEGYRGDAREAQVPALLEMLGYPYSGSKVSTLALTLDKAMTKRVLHYYGLPTPAFQLFETPNDPIDSRLHYPLFAKPNSEGTGIGIAGKSIVHNKTELRARVAELLEAYHEPVLVERYIEGRDLTVGIVGNGNDLHIFPILEVDKSLFEETGVPVYGYELKVDLADAYHYHCPALLDEPLANELRRLAVEVMRVTNTLDFARVDFRLDEHDNNRPYILEINSLPGITPISDLTMMALAEQRTHADLVYSVFEAAMKRLGLQIDRETLKEKEYVQVRSAEHR
jgi:D-alanine-D-alanine ligase